MFFSLITIFYFILSIKTIKNNSNFLYKISPDNFWNTVPYDRDMNMYLTAGVFVSASRGRRTSILFPVI